MKANAKPGHSYPKVNGRHVHRTIAEDMLGRPLRKGEIVHHKDDNKMNFSKKNLKVLPGQSAHIKLHVKEMLRRRKELHGY
jgi:hypothetical protein